MSRLTDHLKASSTSPAPVSSPVRVEELPHCQRKALSRLGSWQRFHRGPRRSSKALLRRLDSYPDAVLVAGCQRSGTTMLTRIIAQSAGFRGLALTHDDELDAALALCGEIDLPLKQRYCFQTTYLNDRYPEYAMIGAGHRLVWVLRNPRSVVYSMVYNWRRFALNELYGTCGVRLASTPRLSNIRWPWPLGPTRLEKACLSYSAKTAQIFEIQRLIPQDRVLVVDYDALVDSPHDWLARIFAFIDEPYDPVYAQDVSRMSTGKASQLSEKAKTVIAVNAERTYRECQALVQ